jgi:hypothetical protein
MSVTDQAGELLRAGDELERLGQWEEAWNKLAQAGELRVPPTRLSWGGPGSPGQSVLVRRRIRHLGAELRNARFAALAREHVETVIVATEPRLIPLLSRSFPQVSYVDAADCASLRADSETSYERLASHFGRSDGEIAASFRPLVPKTHETPSGIGIAWHSVNKRKALPALDDWAATVSGEQSPVQSLQYDEMKAGIDQLETLAGRAVGRSPSDQKIDVDGFAALVSSVRGVLTISNTTAHIAGALGKPCVVILDDLGHLSWPVGRDRTPFYPLTRLVRRQGRDWQDVLREANSLLEQLMNGNCA